MRLDKMYKYVNFIANKRQLGAQLTPEMFNILLEEFNAQLFNEEWQIVQLRAKDAGAIVYDMIINSSPLHIFKKNHLLSPTSSNGEVSFPLDLEFLFQSATVQYKGVLRKLEEVSNEEMSNLISNMAGTMLEMSPKFVRVSNGLKVYPSDVGRAPHMILITYLRMPNTPYYDYCVGNESGLPVYMPVGSQIRYDDANVPCLYSSGNAIIATNVSHLSYTPGGAPYSSLTVEIEWPSRVHSAIAGRILAAIGVTMESKAVVDYAGKEVSR